MFSALSAVGIALAAATFQPAETTILFAGDAMTHQLQIDVAKQPDGSYEFESCFAPIAPIVQKADFAIVNLETPIAGAPYKGYPCFCAPDSYVDALKATGFDLMLTANNHALDRRDKGAKRTLDVLDERDLYHVGTYKNQADRDARLPLIVDINGYKVGMLNYTYGTNGITIQGDLVVDYIDRKQMVKDIKELREAGAELIMAAVHWGVEYKLLPHDTQTSLADFLVKQGVELVIGGHPHVIQPIELRKKTPTGKPALVVYSLGNLISNMKTRDTRGGALLEATLSRDPQGNAYVADAKYRLVFVEPGTEGGKNFKLYPIEQITSGSWVSASRDFENAAENIFKKHNINVTRDSSPVK